MMGSRLRITHKLLALVALVVAGFGIVLWGLTAEIDTIRVGGPLYARLRNQADLRQRLSLLRASPSEIRALSLEARAAKDADRLRLLSREADERTGLVSEQFRQILDIPTEVEEIGRASCRERV